MFLSPRLEQRVEKVLYSAPASFPLLERDVRIVHRRVFLDHALSQSEESYAFWLTQILQPWPIVCQARLLYLLTAPEDNDGIMLHYFNSIIFYKGWNFLEVAGVCM